MKKKFLSLMMAAAMVATTSISAFAADNVDNSVITPKEANVVTQDDEDGSAQVQIKGNIQDDKGNNAAATFKVTVPTVANFTVTKEGALVGPSLTVKNEGTQMVEVLAQDFTRGTGAIDVISEDTIAEEKKKAEGEQKLYRNSVSLKLIGGIDSETEANRVAYLGATNTENGVYGQSALGADNKKTSGIPLLKLAPGNERATEGVIRLEGLAGPKKVTSPVSDTFTLTLRIKKVVKDRE